MMLATTPTIARPSAMVAINADTKAIAEDIISTIKGSSALARNAASLEQALHRTKAAEHARSERRRRSRRVIDTGGGPIYAKDCRDMAIQRVVNEAAKQEALIEARQQRAIVRRFNAWRTIHSAVRNWGKNSAKRYSQGTTVTLTRPYMTIYSGPIVKTPHSELTPWEYRIDDPVCALS
ncbi:hypothetical protein PMIN01_11799 [Paraphaeosphaeria minitans]|uniref:Uncharacterized protein n=1 Tax=Paraphaeosphaeria minitans TaxID=565426 RepID=A0A9P6KKR5_9PLEO|nr:hypothetical protein PMIN01_11799 [Paraphaeosphaeria minitans]